MQSNTYHIITNQNELADVLNECLPGKFKNVIESLVNFIHVEKPQELSNVKTLKRHIIIPAREQVSVKCNLEGIVFEKKIPVDFGLELFGNEDFIPILSICLTQNRNNHDLIIGRNMSIRLVNQDQSIRPTEQVHNTEKEKEKLAPKNYHKMAARHRFRDESISREKEMKTYHIYERAKI